MEVLNINKYKRISNLLLFLFIGLALLPFLLEWIQGSSYQFTYLFNRKILPAIWCFFLIIMFFFVPRVHAAGRLVKRETIYMEAVVCAVILIAVKILVGSMLGQLGESPYDLSPKGILGNLFYVLPALASREVIRSYILGTYCNKHNLKVFIFITLLMTASNINYSKLALVSDIEGMAIYFSTEVGPKLCINIMLSYLALYGGPVAAILYGGVQELFHWTTPILSSLMWLAEGAIGILVPIGCILFIVGKYEEQKHRYKSVKEQKGGIIGWSVTAVFSIGLIWFIVGVFPIVPSVVVTGSMEPLIYPGDVILIRQMQTEEQLRSLAEGDVIQFQRDNIRITHRIVEVIDDGLGNLTFRTKGDNNSTEDSRLVHPNDIKGTLVKVVPKVGYPALLIKGSTGEDIGDVEF